MDSQSQKLDSFNSIKDQVIELLEGDEQEFIYLTGAAGTGKTTLLDIIKNELDKKMMFVAPTGIAALNIGGTTINSAFRIGFDIFPEITKSNDPRFNKLLKKLEVLIIDEVSMVRAPMLDAISHSLKIHRGSDKPFGGVNILACGDLFQLPPVIKESEEKIIFDTYDSVYFFSALSFKQIESPKFFELTKSYRQEEDSDFYNLLNNIRLGKDLKETINTFNRQSFNPEQIEESSMIITSRKNRAEQINEEMLKQIEGTQVIAKSLEQGEFNENDSPAPRELKIKIDARVMFIKNDPAGRWVNGTVGIITQCSEKTKKYIKVKVGNDTHRVEREEWNKIRYIYDDETDDMYEEVVSSFKQFPIKLGWAVTIHKAQGLTLESCSIDLGAGAFATGQAYVALSRVKTLNTLNLYRELKPSDVLVDPDILDFHAEHFNQR